MTTRIINSRLLFFILAAAFAGVLGLAGGVPASAQHFDPEHRHAIELTSGPAPLRQWMFPPDSNPDSKTYSDLAEKGQYASNVWRPSINIAYTYAINERWDLNIIVNLSANHYKVSQYVVLDDTKPYPTVDRKSAPTSSWNVLDRLSPAVMANVRWKWFRSDLLRLYTAFGVGTAPGSLPYPTPYLTPIGISIGKKHFYGVAELTESSAAHAFIVGVGFRF